MPRSWTAGPICRGRGPDCIDLIIGTRACNRTCITLSSAAVSGGCLGNFCRAQQVMPSGNRAPSRLITGKPLQYQLFSPRRMVACTLAPPSLAESVPRGFRAARRVAIRPSTRNISCRAATGPHPRLTSRPPRLRFWSTKHPTPRDRRQSRRRQSHQSHRGLPQTQRPRTLPARCMCRRYLPVPTRHPRLQPCRPRTEFKSRQRRIPQRTPLRRSLGRPAVVRQAPGKPVIRPGMMCKAIQARRRPP